jgi:hypothetical protein
MPRKEKGRRFSKGEREKELPCHGKKEKEIQQIFNAKEKEGEGDLAELQCQKERKKEIQQNFNVKERKNEKERGKFDGISRP